MNVNGSILLKHLRNHDRWQPIQARVYPSYRPLQIAQASWTTRMGHINTRKPKGILLNIFKMHFYRVSENLWVISDSFKETNCPNYHIFYNI